MKQQGKPGPPPALTGAGRGTLLHHVEQRSQAGLQIQPVPVQYDSSPAPLTPARPKMHCLQNPPRIHSKKPWRLLLLCRITQGEFWQRAFAAAHHLCRFLWWLLVEISVSLAQPSPLLGKKTTLPLSQFSPFVCKGEGWRGKDFSIVNNQSDLTASKSALCSVHGNSFWHCRRRNKFHYTTNKLQPSIYKADFQCSQLLNM